MENKYSLHVHVSNAVMDQEESARGEQDEKGDYTEAAQDDVLPLLRQTILLIQVGRRRVGWLKPSWENLASISDRYQFRREFVVAVYHKPVPALQFAAVRSTLPCP